MITYKTALKDIRKDIPNLKPIKLIIGDKQFEGVEVPDGMEDDCGNSYISMLLIKASSKDIEFLGKDFSGKEFDIYGECNGKDFIFMGKAHKFQRRYNEWPDKEWKEYKYKSNLPEFEIIYIK